ncbi:lycopene cyclase family protein [Mesonia maritima]|uniref:Lycopene beta-cyclase n=1 Tax=Mesonia maritima TaxID=1793873 RepID=A0ABU1K4B6_9FLAO|nr:lycopene cyclase family protein [Mesonia maritima]MDR6300455.1 lycopene beta-cyclase [Mesonia maritima]
MATSHFDYIIAGNGLAGLQLALAFAEDEFFKEKKIALIDKSAKSENDKTWCFWEKGNGKWDEIIFKTWKKGKFISDRKKIDLALLPYSYKMIRSIDFYRFAKEKISSHSNFTFILDEINAVEENETVTLHGKENSYNCKHLFDSRIPPEFFQPNNSIKIQQHFKGWMIETEKPVFNDSTFTMMDYRLQWKNSTSFSYILPISPTKAFVEFTFFTPFLVEENVYDKMLQQYIAQFLNIENYSILETEFGIIPMTDFPFEKYNTSKITKIGTAGGWVKASTGYSFKSTEKKVAQLIENLKDLDNPTKDLYDKKFQYYDKLFLSVLAEENEKGKWIFEQFYSKNTIQDIFQYLDEETEIPQDLRIMGSLFSVAFIKAFFRNLFN